MSIGVSQANQSMPISSRYFESLTNQIAGLFAATHELRSWWNTYIYSAFSFPLHDKSWKVFGLSAESIAFNKFAEVNGEWWNQEKNRPMSIEEAYLKVKQSYLLQNQEYQSSKEKAFSLSRLIPKKFTQLLDTGNVVRAESLLRYNSSSFLEWTPFTSLGLPLVSTFYSLPDTPSSATANKVFKENALGNALDYDSENVLARTPSLVQINQNYDLSLANGQGLTIVVDSSTQNVTISLAGGVKNGSRIRIVHAVSGNNVYIDPGALQLDESQSIVTMTSTSLVLVSLDDKFWTIGEGS